MTLGHSVGLIQGPKFRASWRGFFPDSDTLTGHSALAGTFGPKEQEAFLPGTGKWRDSVIRGECRHLDCHLIFGFLQSSWSLTAVPETLDSSLCGLETIVGTCDPQEHCYHFVIIPKEDQSLFGDHPWPMGSWDGQSFSLWHQA